jgi:hypothetical protein
VRPTLAGLHEDLAQLTQADLRTGYTIGVQVQRQEAQLPAFARLRLRAVPEVQEAESTQL